jgi:beta-lactamase regulating signal transducer with metallopeptidase domain
MAMTSWAVQTALITTAMVLVLNALDRRWPTRPADRHLLWVLVLARFVMPPVITFSILPSLDLLPSPFGVVTDDPLAIADAAAGPLPRPFVFTEDDEAMAWADPAELADDALASIDAMGTVSEDLGPSLLVASMTDAPASSSTATVAPSTPVPRAVTTTRSGISGVLESAIAGAWVAGSLGFLCWQGWAVWRFRRCLKTSDEPRDDLVAEVARLSERMKVRAPRMRVVTGLGTPALWCPWPGVVELLIPAHLLKSQSPEAWRAVLAHELGHRKRLDHWTGWLVLAAGLAWWWHPAYWVARRRLEAEAELACDAWSVWAEPNGRRALAGALFELACVSRPVPAPVVGATGAGPFFERRLIMILKRNVPARLSAGGLMAAAAAALLIVPNWAPARDDDEKKPEKDRPAAEARVEAEKPDRETAEKKAVELDKARQQIKELEERVESSRKEMAERIQRAQKELQEQMMQSQKAMQEAMEKLMEARRKLAEAEGRPMPPQGRMGSFMIERGGPGGMMMGPGGMPGMMFGRGGMMPGSGPAAPGRPGRAPVPPRPPGAPDDPNARGPHGPGGPGPEVERRLERLENQLQELMRELRDRPAREGRGPAERDRPARALAPEREGPARKGREPAERDRPDRERPERPRERGPESAPAQAPPAR